MSRDVNELDEGGAAAAIESLAENAVTRWWRLCCSTRFGLPGAYGYRMANTWMRCGIPRQVRVSRKVAARVDDLANLIPSD